MSIKTFNNEANKWEKHSSMMASSIQVMDLEGNFEGDINNVEDCFKEVKTDIKGLKDDVKYIYENGTIGGDPNGNTGSVLPVVSIISPDSSPVYVTSSEVVEIKYSFTSPNRGGGTATLICNGKITKVPVSQNDFYTWKVGPFERNSSGYKASIQVVDSQGFGSVPEEVMIIAGAIDISSTFDPKQEFTMNEDIIIPLKVEADTSEGLTLECKLRGAPHDTLNGISVRKGLNDLNVGRLPAMGVNKIEFKVSGGKYTSNELKYNLIASDSIHLYMSSEFESEFSWRYGNRLVIDYRLSKRGEYQYLTNYYIDDMDNPAFEDVKSVPSPNINYWDLGTSLSIGRHKLKIVSRTLDGQNSAYLTFTVNVTADGFEPHPATPGAIAFFNAEGKQNSGTNKTQWRSEVGDMVCNLYGFNYETNGFFDNALKFEGKSYAVIDYAPFANGLNDNGFTFEITYKAKNTGDNNARVMHCKNMTNGQGMYIDTEYASFQTKAGALARAGYEEDTYVTKTFVLDPTYKVTLQNPEWEKDKTQERWLPPSPNGVIKVFTNGAITAVDYFDTIEGSDFKNLFKYSGKILLGALCEDNSNGQDLSTVKNFGSCDIKSIRIYNKYLSDNEVLDNYISLQDEDTQRKLIRINDLKPDVYPYAGIATVDILDDLSNLEEGYEIATTVTYIDYLDSKNNLNACPAMVSWQGTSSKDYPVKNYTIKLLAGNGGDNIPLVTYAPNPAWLPEYRWTLKANYMDSSQANNVGTAKFIHDFNRGKYGNIYPQQQLNPKTRSCVDGIPVRLRIGDENMGVYTFNIDRYAHQNYGLSTYEQLFGPNQRPIGANIINHATAVSYEIAGNNTESSKFLTADFEKVKHEWKHRFNYREKENDSASKVTIDTVDPDTGEIVTSLRSANQHSELLGFLQWMADCTEEEFWNNAKHHISMPHLIDYYLICQVFGMVDSLGKNMVWTTFGPSKDENDDMVTIWYPSFYDCDTILGVNNVGQLDVSSGIEMTEYVQRESKLWNLLTKADPMNPYPEMINKRYAALRKNVLSGGQVIEFAPFDFEHLIKFFENNLINEIGQKFYNSDAEAKYIKKKVYLHMCSGPRLSFTRRWLKERLTFLDSHYEATTYTDSRIALRSNKLIEDGLIRIKTYSPCKVKIQLQDGAAPIKKRCNRNEWTEFRFTISNDENNNTTIMGAENIMEIEGLKDLNISFLDIQRATKLTNLDVSGNTRLSSIVMNNNRYLRKLDISGCTSMGTDDKVQRINLAACENIRSVNVSRTKLRGIDFNSVGGYIDYLNISNTLINSLNIIGQGYLTEIISNSTDNMTSFVMKKCNAIPKIEIINSKLDTLTIEECDNLHTVNISGTAYLDQIKTILCPKLTTLILSRVNGPGVSALDLTTSLELTELNITNSSIKHIKFGQYTNESGKLVNYDKLKTFNASGSALISIGFGVNAQFSDNDRLNLANLPNLSSVNFSQCNSLRYIDNIKVDGYTSFNQCSNLIGISGTLKLRGSIDSIFYGCSNITQLPTFNMAEVTSMDHTFYACPKLTMAQAKDVLSTVTSTLKSLRGTFRSCAGIVGEIPSDFFSKCTGVTTIEWIFGNTTGITGGIGEILKPMGKTLTNMTDSFKSTSLTICPTSLSFAALDVIRSMTRAFNGTKITTVPEANIFTNQKRTKTLVSVHSMFSGCSQMEGEIPETLLHGLDNLTDVAYLFSGTKVSGEIPPRIFDIKNGANNSLVTVGYVFNGTKITGKIPPNLLKYCPNLTAVDYLFCNTAITGRIPDDLFANNPRLISASYAFYNCTKLGTGLDSGEIFNLPKSLFKGKNSLSNTAYMFTYTKIVGSIEKGTFDDCTSLTNIEGMFMGCSNLTGQLPLRVSEWKKEPHPDFPDLFPDISIDVEYVSEYGVFDKAKSLSKVNYLFKNCLNMVSTIPYSLLIGASSSLEEAKGIFDGCYRITGEVPKELFAKATNLKDASECFRYCRSLNNPNVHDPDAEERVRYIVHPDLFKNNPKLETVNSLFYMYQEYPPAGVPLLLSGTMPPDLFKYNPLLRSCSSMFTSVPLLTGQLQSNVFNNCTNLEDVSGAFHGSGLTGVDRDLFLTSNRPINFYWAFRGMENVTTETFDYDRLKRTPSNRTGCFTGSTFTNMASVPNEWK